MANRMLIALLGAALTLPAQKAQAIVDQIYECVVTGQTARIASEEKVFTLRAGAIVKLRHSHVAIGYLPVTIKLPGGHLHKAKSASSLFGKSDQGPRDSVSQLPTAATWTHYPSRHSDKTIVVKLAQCERVNGF